MQVFLFFLLLDQLLLAGELRATPPVLCIRLPPTGAGAFCGEPTSALRIETAQGSAFDQLGGLGGLADERTDRAGVGRWLPRQAR